MRRTLALAGAGVVVVLVLIAVGRWEGDRFDDEQNRGLERVAQAVGPLDQRSLTHYRLQANETCLVYRRSRKPLALELCYDAGGRLIEAVDRRGAKEQRWSLRPHPAGAAIRVDPAEVMRLRERLYENARAEALKRRKASGS